MQLTRQSRWDGLIQKLQTIELLNINLLSPLDTHVRVRIRGLQVANIQKFCVT